MLTYSLDKKGAIPLYEQLYRAIKKDITIGILKAGEKLLSKRYLAKRLGISIVTVETSYQQLKAEGYIYSQAKKGFFVSEINPHHPPVEKNIRLLSNPEIRPDEAKLIYDLVITRPIPKPFHLLRDQNCSSSS